MFAFWNSVVTVNSADFRLKASLKGIQMKAHNCDWQILRRLGPDPHENGQKTISLNGCPDLFELSSGSFLAIGRDITDEARGKLPASASCGPDERIIELPRRTLVLAKQDIPDKL
jgi:hypothetical protein